MGSFRWQKPGDSPGALSGGPAQGTKPDAMEGQVFASLGSLPAAGSGVEKGGRFVFGCGRHHRGSPPSRGPLTSRSPKKNLSLHASTEPFRRGLLSFTSTCHSLTLTRAT